MEKEINKFIDYLKYQKNYSIYTCNNYKKDLKEYNNFIVSNKLNYKNLSYEDATKYLKFLNEEKNAKSSISRKLSSIRSFYKFLVLNNITDKNIFLIVSSPKKDKKIPKFINYSDINEIFNVPNINTSLGQRERLILEILYGSGVRVSELVNIKLKDINLNNKSILIYGKGSKERIVSFGDYAYEMILKYIMKEELIYLEI